MPGYSLGPISSDEFPTLLHDAIPASEGKVHVFGEVTWGGFRDSRNYPAVSRYFHLMRFINRKGSLATMDNSNCPMTGFGDSSY